MNFYYYVHTSTPAATHFRELAGRRQDALLERIICDLKDEMKRFVIEGEGLQA